MKLILSQEEALASLIALERKRKPSYWEREAIDKIARALGLKPKKLSEIRNSI